MAVSFREPGQKVRVLAVQLHRKSPMSRLAESLFLAMKRLGKPGRVSPLALVRES